MSTIITIGIIAAVISILFAVSYVKAPPDMAFIISGLKRRIIIGAANFRIPFFERLDKVTLELIQVDVKTSEPVPNADFINVNVDAVVNIKVGRDKEKIDLAAMNFLNADSEYIASVAKEVLEGNMREIVGQMHTKEMVLDRQKFADMVKTNADPDLARMGLEIISFNVQNFSDNDKAIENLGIDNIAQISKDAAIARANAERDVAVAKAQAAKEANDADVESQTEIAKKQNELAIKKAELKKDADTQIAIAEAAKGIMAEEQRKVKEIKAGDANVAAQEKVIEIKEREIAITEKQLDASIKKKADADKYAIQMKSDASLYETQKNAEADLYKRAKDAEARQIEAEREAEAKKALAEADFIKGENEAKVIAAKGDAEAAAKRAVLLAEAEGISKKADALARMNEVGQLEMQLQIAKAYIEQLPAIAKGVAEGWSKVGSITMYGDQTAKINNGIIDTMAQITDAAKSSLGIDLKSVLAGAIGTKLIGGISKKED
jgi:flotillin